MTKIKKCFLAVFVAALMGFSLLVPIYAATVTDATNSIEYELYSNSESHECDLGRCFNGIYFDWIVDLPNDGKAEIEEQARNALASIYCEHRNDASGLGAEFVEPGDFNFFDFEQMRESMCGVEKNSIRVSTVTVCVGRLTATSCALAFYDLYTCGTAGHTDLVYVYVGTFPAYCSLHN
jgi:hypothetical protein